MYINIEKIKLQLKDYFERFKGYASREHVIAIIFAMLLVASLFVGMILWIFSIGDEIIETPNILGKDTLSALEILTPTGLGLKIEGWVYNNKFPKGFIVSQDPEPDKKIRKNRDIKIVISRGTEMVPLPNLLGLSTRQAKVVLQEAGLVKGDESFVSSEKTPYNRIIAQTPNYGMLVKRGVKINLLISLGPEKDTYLMPDCVGKRIYYIENLFNKIGIIVGEVKYEYNLELSEDTIINQNPEFSTPIKEGEKIKFTVTRKEVFYSDKTKLTKYIILYYIPPIGILKKDVKIIVEDTKTSSRETAFLKEKANPGEKIELILKITGSNKVIKTYLDDQIVDERKL